MPIKEVTSASYSCSRQVSGSVARQRRPAARSIALSSLAALLLIPIQANGEVFKCVDAAGKTSYQADPCQTPAETPAKVQAPTPPPPPIPVVRQPDPPAVTPAATNPKAAIGSTRPTKDRVPTEAEFRGPRETWERLGLAIRRGDKDAALKELTPSARQRLASVFDTIGSKSTPLNAEDFGSIRSVMLAGDGLATITLTRTRADGTYVHQVHLIRDADGKWQIENM